MAVVAPDFVIGDIEVTRVVEFEVAAPAERPPPSWLVDGGFTDGSGSVLVCSSALVIRAGGRLVVVDPWLVFDGDPEDVGAGPGGRTRSSPLSATPVCGPRTSMSSSTPTSTAWG